MPSLTAATFGHHLPLAAKGGPRPRRQAGRQEVPRAAAHARGKQRPGRRRQEAARSRRGPPLPAAAHPDVLPSAFRYVGGCRWSNLAGESLNGKDTRVVRSVKTATGRCAWGPDRTQLSCAPVPPASPFPPDLLPPRTQRQQVSGGHPRRPALPTKRC